jgi:uncharacterized membrane protein YcjF (UPF0283 family)
MKLKWLMCSIALFFVPLWSISYIMTFYAKEWYSFPALITTLILMLLGIIMFIEEITS